MTGGSCRVCLHLRVTCSKGRHTENPERLRQLTACTIMILSVYKTDQDKRALKYKSDEEKLSVSHPPLSWFPVKSLWLIKSRAVTAVSRYSAMRGNTSPSPKNWQLFKITTVETLIDWFFSVLG